jgi:hypothetical protein
MVQERAWDRAMRITPAFLIETDDGVPLVTRKSEAAEAWLNARETDVTSENRKQRRTGPATDKGWGWRGIFPNRKV